MRRPWSIPAKAALTAAIVSCAMLALQAWIVTAAVRTELPQTWATLEAEAPDATLRAALRAGGAGAAAYAFCTALSGIFAFHVTRHRTARLTSVLQQIADGDLRASHAPLLDSDLLVVREALARMQTALHELTGRLRHTDAQRRRLFADLAHELATPTSTILAIAEALTDRRVSPTAGDRQRFEQVLEQEASRLERLVGDVRELAHLDDPDSALEMTRADLGALARRVAERMNAADPRAAAIAVVAEPAPASVDPGRIDQVLVNLLGNARRYTPPDGVIAVAVRPEGDQIVLVVEDSGVGVPDDMLPRLGERLLRLDPSRSVKTGGHGLGLSIVSAVVQRHGGRLRFERAALGGLRVVIALPA